MNRGSFVGHISAVQASLSASGCLLFNTREGGGGAHFFSWIDSNSEERWVNFRNHRNLTRPLNKPFSLVKAGVCRNVLAFPYQRCSSLCFPSLFAHNWWLPFSSVSSEPASAGIPSTTCWLPGNAASPTRSDEWLVAMREVLWHQQCRTLSRGLILYNLSPSSLISLCFPSMYKSKMWPLLFSLHLHGCRRARGQSITDWHDSTMKSQRVQTSIYAQSLKRHFAHTISKNGRLEPVRIMEMTWCPVAVIYYHQANISSYCKMFL